MKLFSTSYICLLLLLIFGAQSCKKDDITQSGTFSAADFTFNRATKGFTPDTAIKAEIHSSSGVKFVYCYLIRSNATDSLIYVANNAADSPDDYKLSIPTALFPLSNMATVTGVKVLAKEGDNNSVEGFIKITYFDPALPAFSTFATSINADLTGAATAITGKISSESGLSKIEIFDDYQTENTYVAVSTISDLNQTKEYTLNYAYMYRKAAQHIKIRATDIYNQTKDLIIAMPVDLEVFKPKFLNFAASVTPAVGANSTITGTITSVTGLKQVNIYDDYQGAYVLVNSISNLNGNKNYTFSYDYAFRMRAEHLKIIAIDTDNLQSEKVIGLNYNYLSKIYRDVFMTAHTLGTNTIFFAETGTTLGNCSLNASEATMSFLFYAQSAGPTFYSPTNTATVATNFKCNGTGWTIANSASLKATRFRVLVKGSSTGVDNIYNLFSSDNIDALDDAFFTANVIAAPSGSSARFDPVATPTTGIFNLTNAYLIYVRIPDVGGTTYKNAIIRAKEVVSASGNSTVKFDILIQK